MKRLIKKCGFSLVECIVAMAVLSIMSLMLATILTASINTRNKNMSIERDLDKQIDNAVKENASETNASIAFPAGSNFILPSNGGVKLGKNLYSGDEVALGELYYDLSSYVFVEEIFHCNSCNKDFEKSKLINGRCSACGSIVYPDNEKSRPCYGGAKTDSGVTVKEKKTLHGDFYSVEWEVSFRILKEYSKKELALKIRVPQGGRVTALGKQAGGCDGEKIASDTVRLAPNETQYGYEDHKWIIYFNISKTDYDGGYNGNLSKYFTGIGTGTSITVNP